MSFNPVLARTPNPNGQGGGLMPLCAQGERLLLVREKTALKMLIASKTYSGKGIAFLTSRRLVFLKEGDVSKHHHWSSCEFLFSGIHNKGANNDQPEFQQPIFGANRLVFFARPAPSAEFKFEDDANVELTFKDACYTFVKLFLILMRAANAHGGDATGETTAILQNLQAFADQRDPSRIFFAQPPQQMYSPQPGANTMPTTPQMIPPQQQPPYQQPNQYYQQQPQYQPMPTVPPPQYYQQGAMPPQQAYGGYPQQQMPPQYGQPAMQANYSNAQPYGPPGLAPTGSNHWYSGQAPPQPNIHTFTNPG